MLHVPKYILYCRKLGRKYKLLAEFKQKEVRKNTKKLKICKTETIKNIKKSSRLVYNILFNFSIFIYFHKSYEINIVIILINFIKCTKSWVQPHIAPFLKEPKLL
jgi:hypothetical protein